MKRQFRLQHSGKRMAAYFIEIVGQKPADKPYVTIYDDVQSFFIADEDLETFAVNVLKALKSDKLKSSTAALDWEKDIQPEYEKYCKNKSTHGYKSGWSAGDVIDFITKNYNVVKK